MKYSVSSFASAFRCTSLTQDGRLLGTGHERPALSKAVQRPHRRGTESNGGGIGNQTVSLVVKENIISGIKDLSGPELDQEVFLIALKD